MADPTKPDPAETSQISQQTGQNVEQINAVLQAHEKIVRSNSAAQSELNEETEDYDGTIGALQNKLSGFGVSLGNIGNLVDQQATAFGLLSAGLIKTKEHFNQYYEGLDTKRLGSFTIQTQQLVDTVRNAGPVLGIATDAGKKLIGTLSSMGLGGKALNEVMGYGADKLADFAKNMIMGADNTLRFQSVMLQGVVAGGGMDQLYDGLKGMEDVFGGIGPHLEHLNDITQKFIAIQADAGDATGLNNDELSKYTAMLLQSPAGLEAMAKGMNIATTHMGTLTAVTQLAQGAGLDIGKTYQAINKVIYETGMNYEGATSFATRFVDVSKDLHARSDDVQTQLMKASSAFKLWSTNGEQAAKMNQGLADSVKNYAAALEAAGVPAQNALAIAESQTEQMGALSEAQESFISQSTGGMGGIKGALEYEELLKTDPVAAQKKMVQTMERQIGGKAITREEALRTGQEDKYMLERKLLMGGTLGMKAGSTAEAEDMLAAMAKGVEYHKTTAQDVAKTQADTIQRGREQESLTYTGIKQANLTAERVMLTAGTIQAGILEKALSAGAGESTSAGAGLNVDGMQGLEENRAAGALGQSGQNPAGAALEHIGKTMSALPTLIPSAFTSIKEQAIGPAVPDLGTIGTMNVNSQGLHGQDNKPLSPMLGDQNRVHIPTNHIGYLPAGRQVGAAVPASANTSGQNVNIGSANSRNSIQPTANQHMGGPIPVTIAGGNLTMNLTGICPHCKAPITTSLQSQATNVAANTG